MGCVSPSVAPAGRRGQEERSVRVLADIPRQICVPASLHAHFAPKSAGAKDAMSEMRKRLRRLAGSNRSAPPSMAMRRRPATPFNPGAFVAHGRSYRVHEDRANSVTKPASITSEDSCGHTTTMSLSAGLPDIQSAEKVREGLVLSNPAGNAKSVRAVCGKTHACQLSGPTSSKNPRATPARKLPSSSTRALGRVARGRRC